MADKGAVYIRPDQLTLGIYVCLDLGWMDHPFTFSQFRIKSEEQLRQIRELGLQRIRVDPTRSSSAPLPLPPDTPQHPSPSPPSTDPSPELIAKRDRIAKLKARVQSISQCEKYYLDAAKSISNITRNILSRPEETLAEADSLATQLASSLLAEQEIAVHLMNDKVLGEEVYYHSLNVSVLAMILGRAMGLSEQDLRLLGMGGIFHDLGKMRIPHKVLQKADNPSKAELDFIQLHTQYGLEIGQKVKLPLPILRMIHQHHEFMDGSGYPQHLKGDAIDPLTRLLTVVNTYDNLCNPVLVVNALTPHEALSLMFSQQRARFDTKALSLLVHTLGVYPPGTVVRLNNDGVGMVMSVNSAQPLKPHVLIYDEQIPRNEAMILDLAQETDLNIAKAVRPAQLSTAVYN
ncbi:MAG: DUF3391 domain-containing protein, partial [Pseudomonadales bacterium]|nr:DUF3391 domain-containing protein [Pseudomonadales bacterium]